MKKLLFFISLMPLASFAQQDYNPFEAIGKKVTVVTLSNGRYKETYGGDTVKRIANVMFDIRTNKIVKFLEENDTTTYEFRKGGDLSTRWLSIDPLAAKYPYLTPYNFVNNNPIIYIDPDGRDWIVTKVDDGRNIKIKIVLDVAVLNSTGKTNYDQMKLQDAIAQQVTNSYSQNEIKYENGKFGVFEVEVQVNIRTLDNRGSLASNEHLIEVLPENHSLVKGIYGQAKLGIYGGGKHLVLNEKYIQNIIEGDDNNTVPHELGHTAGLFHSNGFDAFLLNLIGSDNSYFSKSKQEKKPLNAMYSNASSNMYNKFYSKGTTLKDKTSIEFDRSQIENMSNDYQNGDLNKSEYFDTKAKE